MKNPYRYPDRPSQDHVGTRQHLEGLTKLRNNRPFTRSSLLLLCLAGLLLSVPLDSFAEQKAAQSLKKLSPQELLAQAQALESQKQYDQAAAAYRKYLTVRPNDASARMALARVLAQQGSYREAIGLYESLLSKAPTNPEARRGLADTLYVSGQSALALQHYEALYADTKDPAVAERIRQVTAELEPSPSPTMPAAPPTPVPLSPEQMLERARALEAAQQYQGAVSAYQAYLAAQPEDDDVRRSLARLLFTQGQYREVSSAYQAILSRHPSDTEALVALGKIAVQQMRISDGRRYYEAALRTDPSDIEAKHGLADLLYWYKEYTRALHFYEDVFSATQNPAVGRRIQEIRHQQVVSPQAPIGKMAATPALPFRSYMKLGYGQYNYTEKIPEERDGLLEIATPFRDYTVVARLEYLKRFGLDDVPISAELYGPLWRKAWGMMSGSFATNPSFVPNFRIGTQIFQDLGVLHQSLSFLEASFGYERLAYTYRANTSPTLFIPAQDVSLLTPSLTMYLPFNVWLTEKLYFVPETGSITLSSKLTWRPTDRLQLFASGGFGTSGERIYAFQDFTRAKTRSFQGGAIFPLTDWLSGELSGFYEDRGFLYIRRGGTFNLIWHW